MSARVDLPTVAFVYLAPIFLLLAVLLVTSAIVWSDERFGTSRMALTGDLARKFELQHSTERFRRLSRMSYGYVLWAFGNSGVQAIAFYRFSSFLQRRGMRLPADLIRRCGVGLTGIDISPYAQIGRGLVIHHGQGIVIGKNTSIGDGVTLYHDVTTGSGRPRLEDGVVVWPGARIIGNVTVGSGSQIGANAVVLDDIPPDSIAVGVPADRILRKSDPQTAESAARNDV